MTNKLLKLTLAVAVGFFALGLAPHAQAAQNMALCLTTAPGNVGGDCTAGTFIYILSDGTAGGTTITTGGGVNPAGVTVGPNDISFNGAVGGWTVNVSTGINLGPTGGIDLNTVDSWGGTGANTLDVYFSSTGNSGGPYTAKIGGTNGNGSTTYDGCINPNDLNLTFCGQGPSPDVGSRTFTANGGFSANYGTLTGTAPFGLMEQLNLVANSADTFSGDYRLQPVPEPTSILLLGGVLALAGRSLRKKYQKAA